MVRLFVTLFIVLIATLFIGILSVQKIDATLFTKVNSEFYAGLTLGTFELLDESIAGKSGTQLQATVIGIKDQFDSPIDLISTQQSDLPKKGMDILEGGGIYMRDFVTDSVVLRKSRETDGIWSITMDTSELDENIAIATGPLNLVKDKLTATIKKSTSCCSVVRRKRRALLD